MLGFLLMSWGGALASHSLLSLPPPQLYTVGPWINYSAAHLLFTLLFHYFPVPDPSFTNAILSPLDGLLRANSVLHTTTLLANPSVNRLLEGSPLFHFILGAAASAGGGLVGGSFSLWTPDWQFSMPPPLRTDSWGLWSTLDIWAGGVVAVTYGILIAHPAFQPLRAYLTLAEVKPSSIPAARDTCATIMVALYGLRAVVATVPSKAAKPPLNTEQSGKKVKTQ